MLGHLGAMLGPCWAILGPAWAYVGPSWAILEPCWAYVGPSWGHLGASLGLCWAVLGHLGAMLGLCWAILGPSFFEHHTQNTLNYNDNRGSGVNRNRHEVSTRWSAAGAASVYNLRLPPKASGHDTGAGPASGLADVGPMLAPRPSRCPVVRSGPRPKTQNHEKPMVF